MLTLYYAEPFQGPWEALVPSHVNHVRAVWRWTRPWSSQTLSDLIWPPRQEDKMRDNIMGAAMVNTELGQLTDLHVRESCRSLFKIHSPHPHSWCRPQAADSEFAGTGPGDLRFQTAHPVTEV